MSSSEIKLDATTIETLDLTAAREAIAQKLKAGITDAEQSLRFVIDVSRDPSDPRELSEIPEIRLWFVRLDASYPWLPLLLDWSSGELARYVAMLVPHEFHRTEGIQFNPEALEIFLMSKIFVIADWLEQQGCPSRSRLKAMSQLLGYELDDGLFDLLLGKG
ncbi:CRR6 family NdhI maturation factor [Sodalinema gerasimenkoae]|uniref:CRR6 family NdhI maturation factor n=1 Tax=Sodalinema gerasimenkoae TaxID=2862348 RepID=UPI001359D4D2|nr:CRR6 family NdhI maturation factor [Sodalinema gerasimenkoae]